MTPIMADVAANPRGGNTITCTRIVPRDTPGAHPTNRGTEYRIAYYLTPYQRVAATVAEILAGRPVADQERADQLVADFDATADMSPGHALFVAAVHNIAADAAPYPTDPLTSYDASWPVHEAFETAFPRPVAPAVVRETTCRHGVPYTDDCEECET